MLPLPEFRHRSNIQTGSSPSWMELPRLKWDLPCLPWSAACPPVDGQHRATGLHEDVSLMDFDPEDDLIGIFPLSELRDNDLRTEDASSVMTLPCPGLGCGR
jgi:hypothetical protein